MNRNKRAFRENERGLTRDQRGFTYMDVMCALLIMMVGVLALAAAVTGALVRTRDSEQQLKAKQYANSTMESIFSARDINRLGWDSISNVGSGSGVFLTGTQTLYADAGADRVVGTGDDTGGAVSGFRRQIIITDINDPERPSPPNPIMIRRVDVTIYYQANRVERQEKLSTTIAKF